MASITLFFIACLMLPAQAEKVLIVADEWEQMEILEQFLEEQGRFEVEKTEQNDMPADLSSYAAVIEFVHRLLNDEPAQQMITYTRNGGRTIVMHHGVSAAKKKTKGWYDFLGMELDRTEKAENYYEWVHGVDYYLVNLQPEHYITSHKVNYPEQVEYRSSDTPSVPKTLPALLIENSEIFINHQFTDAREKIVLFGFKSKEIPESETENKRIPQTDSPIMQDRGGWYKPAGKGYVFYLQPGHAATDMDTNYCQIIMNCITWKPEKP